MFSRKSLCKLMSPKQVSRENHNDSVRIFFLLKEENVTRSKKLSSTFPFFHEEIAVNSQTFAVTEEKQLIINCVFSKSYSSLYIESMCSFWLLHKLSIMNFRKK